MSRINDSVKDRDLKPTVNAMALRINQLERLLDRQELNEAKVVNGTVYSRKTKLSLNNGRTNQNWEEADISAASGVTKIVAGTNVTISPSSGVGTVTVNSSASGVPAGGSQYQVLQRDAALAAVWDWVRWV